MSPQAVPQLHCPSCENAITSIQDLRSVASVGWICSKCVTSIESPLNLEARKPQEPGEDGEGHVAAAPESAENGGVAVGQAVLSQKRKKGGRTGESAKRVYQKRTKGGRTGESAKRVYRAQPIFATWSQERIFVPIGLLDGDELRRELLGGHRARDAPGGDTARDKPLSAHWRSVADRPSCATRCCHASLRRHLSHLPGGRPRWT